MPALRIGPVELDEVFVAAGRKALERDRVLHRGDRETCRWAIACSLGCQRQSKNSPKEGYSPLISVGLLELFVAC